jgi:predicted nuclease with TOPRIM domain
LSNISWLAPIVVALVSALGTYLAVVRKTSGRIDTTEASKLWEEARNLREVYLGELTRLREGLEAQNAKVEKVEQELEQVHDDLKECHRAERQLIQRIEELERAAV